MESMPTIVWPALPHNSGPPPAPRYCPRSPWAKNSHTGCFTEIVRSIGNLAWVVQFLNRRIDGRPVLLDMAVSVVSFCLQLFEDTIIASDKEESEVVGPSQGQVLRLY